MSRAFLKIWRAQYILHYVSMLYVDKAQKSFKKEVEKGSILSKLIIAYLMIWCTDAIYIQTLETQQLYKMDYHLQVHLNKLECLEKVHFFL